MTASNWRRWPIVLACQLLWLVAPIASAHGGGLNAEGCHTNRRTGDYHCHRGSASSPPPSEARFSGQGLAGRSREGGTPVRYANCSKVRAAGRAPLRRGEPGYAPHLDRDNDGIACEPPRR